MTVVERKPHPRELKDEIAQRNRVDYPRYTFLLIVAALAVYLIGNDSVPLWDRDEPRYAQCSRQMLQSGDWVVPRLYDQVRTAKPPLIYWCQATAMHLLGESAFAVRLPSALAMAATLVLVSTLLRRYGLATHAFWTVLVLCSSVLTFAAAKSCLTDSVLLLFTTAAQICLYAIWRRRGSWRVVVALGVSLGLAGLTKGPVVLGVQAMTLVGVAVLGFTVRKKAPPVTRGFEVVTIAEPPAQQLASNGGTTPDRPADRHAASSETDREGALASRLMSVVAKVVVTVLVVALIVGPWLILVERRHPGFIFTSLDHELGARARSGLEGHAGPPGYYLAAIWPVFMPWSLVLPLAMVLGWRRRREPHIRFCMAAVLGPWLMFEVVQTKLPHYLLPCFPPLAFLTADAILQCLRGSELALVRREFLRAAVAYGGVLILLAFAPWLAGRWFGPQPIGVLILLSAVGVAYAVIALTLFLRRRPALALIGLGVGMLGIFALLFGVYLPQAEFLRVSVRAADVLKSHGVTHAGQAIMLDYKEPSLAFYQGGSIRENSATILTNRLLDAAPPWLVVTRDVWDASQTEPTARSRLDAIATFKGLDIADGMRRVEVMVLRKKF